MAKPRVHEIAKEIGITSKELLKKLTDMGEYVSSASSTLEAPVVRKVREAFAPKTEAPAAKPAAPKPPAAKPAPRPAAKGQAPSAPAAAKPVVTPGAPTPSSAVPSEPARPAPKPSPGRPAPKPGAPRPGASAPKPAAPRPGGLRAPAPRVLAERSPPPKGRMAPPRARGLGQVRVPEAQAGRGPRRPGVPVRRSWQQPVRGLPGNGRRASWSAAA